MKVELLVDVLTRSGTTIGRTRAGALVLHQAPPALAEAVAHLEPEILLAIAAQGTGHRWARCTSCARPALIATGQGQPCRQTPRCAGRLKAYAKARPEPGNGLPCARPGCTREAVTITHTHEPLCAADALHLALIVTGAQ